MAPPGGFDYAEWIGENAKETTVAIDRQTGIVIHPTIGNAQFQLWGALSEQTVLKRLGRRPSVVE
jgi:hypothetical protein